jgi:hypothetical protein
MTKEKNTKDPEITPYLDAIDIIADQESFHSFEKDVIIHLMTEDIISGKLKLRDAESGKMIKISDLIINGCIQVDDLNQWLENNNYKFKFDSSQPSKKIFRDIPGPQPITKLKVAAVFQDLHYTYDQWKKYLATVPDWLKPCRVSKGAKGRTGGALWDPSEIALQLLDKGISIDTLDFKIHSNLKSWENVWKEKTELLRY